jgi:alpha,alpha-trehalase
MRTGIDPTWYDAVLFDLDGVITDTASVHERAWKRMFDAFLTERPEQDDEDHRPFTHADYRRHVDGRPRADGVAAFLRSRGIELPKGEPSDFGESTVHGLGNRKNRSFHAELDERGVDVFRSTVDLVHELQEHGVATAVFSASRNCEAVLVAAGLGDLFPIRVDGTVAAEMGLPGKPDPSMLLEAARRLGAEPSRTVVVEDAEAGVEAGRRGGFGLVIGVDRAGEPEGLRRRGADVVVHDLSEIDVSDVGRRPLSAVPEARESLDEIRARLVGRPVVVFLDFDGTLSPIVDHADQARPAPAARSTVERLGVVCPVAVISGRDLRDVRDRLGVEGIWYAGSHGFELEGPDGERHQEDAAEDALPALDDAEAELRRRLEGIPGAAVERKRFSLAAHYRRVEEERVGEVVDAVEQIAGNHAGLRSTGGRRVAELRPDLDWDKGRAVGWLMERLSPAEGSVPVYAGDDLTDEDALDAVRVDGLGIVVRSDEHGDRLTSAHVAVDDPEQLCWLLEQIADLLERSAGG